MSNLKDLLKLTVDKQPKKVKKPLKDCTIPELMKELEVVEKELTKDVKFKVVFRRSTVLVDGKEWQKFTKGTVAAQDYLEAVKGDSATKKELKKVVDKKIANFNKALPEALRAKGLEALKAMNTK